MDPVKVLSRILFCISGIILSFSVPGCLKEKSTQPILILANNNNFGTYAGEILKAEGFNEFITDSLGRKKISKPFLAQFDQIILAEQVTDSRTCNMFTIMVFS